MNSCWCCIPLLYNHLMDSCSYLRKNTLLAAKGGSICTHLTPPPPPQIRHCSVTKECYKIGVFLIESSLRSFSLVPLASLFFQKTYLATFLAFQSQNHATKELSRGRYVTSQKQQTSPEMLIYMFSERRY